MNATNTRLPFSGLLVASLLLSTALVAQTTIKTTTAYGAAAVAGTATGNDSKPTNTAVTTTTPLRVTARAGNAYASSYVYAMSTGLTAYESANVYIATNSSSTNDSAGTTTDSTGNVGDAHTVSANIGAKEGTRGQMVMIWTPYITGNGVTLKMVVNVDGKDVATFTQADAGQTKRVDVTVGKTGVDVKITSSGSAAPGAAGRSYYNTSVRAYFQANVVSSPCTFTAFGTSCGNVMKGSALKYLYSKANYHQAILDVTGMEKNEIGLLAVGDKLSTSVTLPAGGCLLHVDPAVIVTIRSSTRILFRNQTPFTAHIEAVTFKLSGSGVKISASNGLTVSCPKP